MIYITTDCVFNWKDRNYDENPILDEINDYVLSKSLGELCKCAIIRTSIIGEEVNNKRSLLEWVICLHLAKIIDIIIRDDLYCDSVHHIFSPHSVSKYE